METALFLPFMQIPTGHHHVADALIEDIESRQLQDIVCSKVDILSYSYGSLEKIVSFAYLNWIKYFPDVYDWLYRCAAYKKTSFHNRQYLYEAMFIHFFKQLTNRQNAHILFCTHALPSNMASVLKMKNKLKPVTVNVYTDYFVNDLWGIEGIDYHFAPTMQVKDYLMAKGVRPEQIYVTGIPVGHVFQTETGKVKTDDTITRVLVTGGSLGVGSLRHLLIAPKSDNIHYYVLCGKNEALYQELLANESRMVTPFPYIANKAEMNLLYDQVDAVLTKPGGVTVSECLMKRKPVFLYHPLPGQERINARQLLELNVAIPADIGENIEEQLLRFLSDEVKRRAYDENLDIYHECLEKRPPSVLMREMIGQKH
ncbi:MGDG synthase family glycosyltransferase [Lentibacillus salicampi]|uniref:UDP-glucuronosyltransferase n=1 Tax=Lentibacillus salicampi TaxID=175306 RepID=A0A4Y9AEE5_9BACI|nr:UDP-glucuronosyltransferase [Lentibacillus salicampi]TFJ93320.1 UDP-glucuronosyltransferase [Lentibacillus salicampi]